MSHSIRIPLVFAGVLAALPAFAADWQPLAVDKETTVNGIEVACTGFGDEAKEDPRWTQYPIRIEFAGAGNEYLADMAISVSTANDRHLFDVYCDAPWLLMRAAPGKYKVVATFANKHEQRATVTIPASGAQVRAIIRFPDVRGE